MDSKQRSQSISFRLPIAIAQAVDIRAAEQGISRGNWVRGQILAAISQPDKEDIAALFESFQSSIEKVESKLAKIQIAQARSLYFCLTQIGNIDPEKARLLIKKKFAE